jgi:ATP-dependent DNA ligase
LVATIELLKPYTPSKMQFPAGFMQKLDGVPVNMQRRESGVILGLSRQGEVIQSIRHIEEACRPLLLTPGSFLVGELYIHGVPFKDISGKVRDTKQQHRDLVMFVFDGNVTALSDAPWVTRYNAFELALGIATEATGIQPNLYPVRRIPMLEVRSDTHADRVFEGFMQKFPKAEGAVLHSYAKRWSPGKRCWGCQKIKAEPTIDLRVVGFEEAVSEGGEPKGMVGRINVELARADGTVSIVGVGPGKLTHEERFHLWRTEQIAPAKDMNLIAEIKYMPDDTYGKLRQPTFQQWRPDKTEPDVLA